MEYSVRNSLASLFSFTGAASLWCAVFILAGCGGGDEPNQSGNSPADTDPVSVTAGDNRITISSDTYDLTGIPVAAQWEGEVPSCMESEGLVVPVQPQTDGEETLLWLPADVPAGEERTYVSSDQTTCGSSGFEWQEVAPDRSRLLVDGRPALEYVHPEFDLSRYEETMKPYHHVYAPDGSQLITKGDVDGLYPHHRGIFYGYRDIQLEGDTVNTWANDGDDLEGTQHVRFMEEWNGPLFGGHQVTIDWRDGDGNVFAEEVRTFRLYPRGDGTMVIDVESRLSTTGEPVALGGDLQHAGLQFRAAQYVADHTEQSRYLRPQQWSDHPAGEELNDTEERLDDPWNAFQFMVEDQSYTVGYLSHPGNPAGGQMSERLYGRFGEFIPGLVIDEGEPLHLQYRFVVAEGHDIDRSRMEAEYAAYAASP